MEWLPSISWPKNLNPVLSQNMIVFVKGGRRVVALGASELLIVQHLQSDFNAPSDVQNIERSKLQYLKIHYVYTVCLSYS